MSANPRHNMLLTVLRSLESNEKRASAIKNLPIPEQIEICSLLYQDNESEGVSQVDLSSSDSTTQIQYPSFSPDPTQYTTDTQQYTFGDLDDLFTWKHCQIPGAKSRTIPCTKEQFEAVHDRHKDLPLVSELSKNDNPEKTPEDTLSEEEHQLLTDSNGEQDSPHNVDLPGAFRPRHPLSVWQRELRAKRNTPLPDPEDSRNSGISKHYPLPRPG